MELIEESDRVSTRFLAVRGSRADSSAWTALLRSGKENMKSHDSVEEVRQLLEVRLQECRQREQDSVTRPKPVITITREPGCGAEAIAEKLCADLGFHLYDWELVEQIAQDAHVSTRLVESLEKRAYSELREWLAGFQRERNLSAQIYLESVRRVLFTLAAHGSAIIMGHGGNFILPVGKRIGLCFVAPLNQRIKNTMKNLGLSEKDARRHISESEAQHRKLVKKYFKSDIQDYTHYELIVNTALVKQDTVVQIVKQLVAARE